MTLHEKKMCFDNWQTDLRHWCVIHMPSGETRLVKMQPTFQKNHVLPYTSAQTLLRLCQHQILTELYGCHNNCSFVLSLLKYKAPFYFYYSKSAILSYIAFFGSLYKTIIWPCNWTILLFMRVIKTLLYSSRNTS